MAQTPPKWLELVERSFRRVFDETVWAPARRCGESVRKPTAKMNFGSELSGTGSRERNSGGVVLGRGVAAVGEHILIGVPGQWDVPILGIAHLFHVRVGDCCTLFNTPHRLRGTILPCLLPRWTTTCSSVRRVWWALTTLGRSICLKACPDPPRRFPSRPRSSYGLFSGPLPSPSAGDDGGGQRRSTTASAFFMRAVGMKPAVLLFLQGKLGCR